MEAHLAGVPQSDVDGATAFLCDPGWGYGCTTPIDGPLTVNSIPSGEPSPTIEFKRGDDVVTAVNVDFRYVARPTVPVAQPLHVFVNPTSATTPPISFSRGQVTTVLNPIGVAATGYVPYWAAIEIVQQPSRGSVDVPFAHYARSRSRPVFPRDWRPGEDTFTYRACSGWVTGPICGAPATVTVSLPALTTVQAARDDVRVRRGHKRVVNVLGNDHYSGRPTVRLIGARSDHGVSVRCTARGRCTVKVSARARFGQQVHFRIRVTPQDGSEVETAGTVLRVWVKR